LEAATTQRWQLEAIRGSGLRQDQYEGIGRGWTGGEFGFPQRQIGEVVNNGVGQGRCGHERGSSDELRG